MSKIVVIPAKYCNSDEDVTVTIEDITDIANLGLSGTQLEDAFRMKYGTSNVLIFATATGKRDKVTARKMRDEMMAIWKGEDIDSVYFKLD